MANRDTPYGAFNFTVSFDGGETFGGFSDVSGIGTELTVAEYRNGNEKENHVRKVPGCTKSATSRSSAASSTRSRCSTGSRRRAPPASAARRRA